MTTATNQIVVFEFELPSGAFSKMSISARKYWETGSYAIFQVTNGGSYFEIGSPDEAMENTVLLDNAASVVETHLTNLPIIATAEVTITGNSWRIEVTEAPSIASSGWHRGTDEHYVGLLPLHFNITVFNPPPPGEEECGCDAFANVPVRRSVADPPADDGDGGALTNVDAGDEPEDQPDPEPEEESGDDLDGLIPPEGDGGALTNVDAGDEPEGDGTAEEAQPETWLEQQLRLANTTIFPADGGQARRQVELNEGELVNVDAGELDGLTLPEDAGGAYSSRYSLYWNPGDSGRFQLRFDDDATDALTPASTAAVIDAALEAMDSITVAEVTGAPGDWTLTITADEGHLLQAIDTAFDGDLQLDYMGA